MQQIAASGIQNPVETPPKTLQLLTGAILQRRIAWTERRLYAGDNDNMQQFPGSIKKPWR